MDIKNCKVTIAFTKSEHDSLKQIAKNNKTTMADLLRQSWMEKQDALGIFNEFDERIGLIEKMINESKGNQQKIDFNHHFTDIDKKQRAIYATLKQLLKLSNGGEL
jgi:hypothetical protein